MTNKRIVGHGRHSLHNHWVRVFEQAINTNLQAPVWLIARWSHFVNSDKHMRLAVRVQTMFSLRLSLNRRLVKHMKNTFRKFGPRVHVHVHWTVCFYGVSWPSSLAYRTQVLVVLAAECGFESRPWHLCPWARHLTIIASLHPGVKWVPVRAELVD